MIKIIKKEKENNNNNDNTHIDFMSRYSIHLR